MLVSLSAFKSSSGSTSTGSDPFQRGDGEQGWMVARSEPHSEASSHISKPKWRRLLCALAQIFAAKLEMAAITGGSLRLPAEMESAFSYSDAGGGGTEFDMFQFTRQLLEDMALSDEETGTTLIGMYHFAGAQDLPLSACTWRPVFVTALTVSLDFCLGPRARVPQERLLLSVSHWWPKVKADHAHRQFVSRATYKQSVFSQSVRMKCYLELREMSLKKRGGPDTTSSVPSFDQSFDAVSVSKRLETPPKSRGRSKCGSSFDNSLMFSEDNSSMPPACDEPVDNGYGSEEVASI